MKSLHVYTHDSHYQYHGLYQKYLFEVQDTMLVVYERDDITGEETVKAQFRTWEYFIVEDI